MAVYKSTRCYPFLSNIDIRTAQTDGQNNFPAQFLTCKVDTSNKNITGYSMRVFDEENNQIFPYPGNRPYQTKISPITELQRDEMAEYYEENGTNSGINGTYLKIPFFQNWACKKTKSFNAIYCFFKYSVDYIITNLNLLQFNYPENSVDFVKPTNWERLSNGNWVFKWAETGHSDEQIKNKVYLDGELILSGQIILVANTDTFGITAGFYKVIKVSNSELVNGTTINETQLEPITTDGWTLEDASSSGYRAIITKGVSLHNQQIRIGTNRNFSFTTGLYADWCDYYGHKINIHTGTSIYKWEITLYQGEGTEASFVGAQYITYDDVDNKNFDMIISSGTILGSNSQRVQIADQSPSLGATTLPSAKNGELVLQGKYMALGDANGNYSTDRCYVQTYDSTYGHVYPLKDDLSSALVGSSSFVQFYKHSLNPEDILANEIIEYGLEKGVTFVYYDSGGVSKTYSEFMDLPINERLYGIAKSNLQSLCPQIYSAFKEGQKILIMNASLPRQNGVYTMYLRSSIPSVFFLKRAASYDTWGAYIGKIIYVTTFCDDKSAITSTNIESLAGSNPDYNLWNPDAVGAGDSNLFFSQERPILLFGNKIKDINFVDLMTPVSSNYSSVSVGQFVDQVIVKVGMKVLYKSVQDGQVYWHLAEIGASGTTIVSSWESQDTPFYVHVSQGRNCGKMVWKFTSTSYVHTSYSYNEDPQRDWSLYRAAILKNSSEYTYISPNLNLQKGMRIKLKGDNYVTLAGNVASKTQWLKVLDCDTNVYCIRHEALSSPLALSSDVTEGNNTPWKYELRSFFKASDFNPFYCYETPYIVLYKNNSEYSSLINLTQQQEYHVVNSETAVEPFYVQDENDNNNIFIVGQYEDANVSYSKVLKLGASYIQGNGLSWESYRWILTDTEGNILQDTGKMYDKDMSVLFYGLSNDSIINYSVYYATIYVEDEIGNILAYTIRLTIKAGDTITSNFPFTADYDCEAHAVKLTYGGSSNLIASHRVIGIEKDSLYIPSNPDFDGGIEYLNEEGFVIKNRNGATDPVVDYSRGSTISEDDGTTSSIESQMSLGTEIGVPYYVNFTSTDALQEITDNNSLKMPGQTESDDDTGQLYFETELSLDDNQCGQILEWIVEGVAGSNPVAPLCYYNTGGTNALNGYLQFKLRSNDNFNNNGDLNPIRNQLYFEIIAYPYLDSQETKSVHCDITKLKLFDLPSTSYYYMQKETNKNLITSDKEFLRFNLSPELYMKKCVSSTGETEYFTSGNNDFGNLCLLTGQSNVDKNSLCYWVEDRPFLISNQDAISAGTYPYVKMLDSTTGQFLKGGRTLNADETSTVLKWPNAYNSGDYQEKDYYWNDSNTNVSQYTSDPLLWEHVNNSILGVTKVVPFDRHYNESSNSWHFLCRIKDIDNLYYGIINGACEIREEQITDNKVELKFTTIGAGATSGSLVIEKITE